MTIPSLEMCVVNVLTLMDSNLTLQYNDPKETNDDTVENSDPHWKDLGFYDVFSQLVSLSSCDAKEISLYKLQSSKMSK
jgi:hypothetical protein